MSGKITKSKRKTNIKSNDMGATKIGTNHSGRDAELSEASSVSSQTVRNLGIDLLRIVAMFMVLVLHILGQGGVIAATGKTGWKYCLVWFLEIAAYSAVNCYALVSGYVGAKSRYKYANFVNIWLRVVYYALIITGLFAVFAPNLIIMDSWQWAITPVMSRQYWYITAYAGLFLLMPLLNFAINSMSRKQLLALVWGLVIGFSVLPTLFRNDVFILKEGYSIWWLMVLYVIGGYIGKYGILRKMKKSKLLICYVVLTVVGLVAKVLLEYYGKDRSAHYIILYTSPLVLAQSVCLLGFFSRLKIRKWGAKLITVFAPLVFSVYIIHVHPLVWKNVLPGLFKWVASMPIYFEGFVVLGIALGALLSLSIVDMVREFLFRVLKVKDRLSKVEKRFVGNLWTTK